MSSLELKAYDILKNKLGEQEAATLFEYFEAKAEAKYQEKKDVLASKEDIYSLKVDIQATKADTIKWMFIFWVGQVAATIAIVKLLVK